MPNLVNFWCSLFGIIFCFNYHYFVSEFCRVFPLKVTIHGWSTIVTFVNLGKINPDFPNIFLMFGVKGNPPLPITMLGSNRSCRRAKSVYDRDNPNLIFEGVNDSSYSSSIHRVLAFNSKLIELSSCSSRSSSLSSQIRVSQYLTITICELNRALLFY